MSPGAPDLIVTDRTRSPASSTIPSQRARHCTTVTFTIRIEGMSNQSINALPTSGTGKLGLLTFDRVFFGNSENNGPALRATRCRMN